MNYEYTYRICGLTIQIHTPMEIWTDEVAERFAAPGVPDPDISIHLTPVEEILTPDAAPRGRSRERAVWLQGDTVTRCCQDIFRPQLHFRADYHLPRPSRVDCLVREADWRWATRSQFLWPQIMLNHLLLHRRGLVFHASYIETRGRAILFTAPSQTGKSTQSELWRVHRGAEILNGDKAAVMLDGAVPMAHGVPFCGTSGICVDRSLPLGAVVVLSQGRDNTVTPLPPSRAVQALCPNVFTDSHVPQEWQLTLTNLLDLCAGVPVLHLSCTPDERAVEALERALGW